MTNYFQLYDLPESFLPDQIALKSKFYELSRLYHPDRFSTAGPDALSQALSMAATINDAYKTLRDPDATMAYVLRLNNMLEDEEKYALPPAFLMEMMDLNEAVSDYEDDPNNEAARLTALNSLAEQLQAWQQAAQTLISRFDAGDHSHAILAPLKDMYFRKKYLLRIQERINRFATQL
jgi:molecular chaperone HscB